MSTSNPPSRNDHVHYKPQRRGTDNSSPSKNSGVDFKISVLGLKVNVQKDDDKDKLQSRPKSMETPRAKPVHVRQDSPQESRGRRASSDARSGNWLSRSLSRSKSKDRSQRKPSSLHSGKGRPLHTPSEPKQANEPKKPHKNQVDKDAPPVPAIPAMWANIPRNNHSRAVPEQESRPYPPVASLLEKTADEVNAEKRAAAFAKDDERKAREKKGIDEQKDREKREVQRRLGAARTAPTPGRAVPMTPLSPGSGSRQDSRSWEAERSAPAAERTPQATPLSPRGGNGSGQHNTRIAVLKERRELTPKRAPPAKPTTPKSGSNNNRTPVGSPNARQPLPSLNEQNLQEQGGNFVQSGQTTTFAPIGDMTRTYVEYMAPSEDVERMNREIAAEKERLAKEKAEREKAAKKSRRQDR